MATIISGTSGDDILDSGPGSQTLLGEEGNDMLIAGTGRRRLRRHPGSDTLDGGEGNDTADFSNVPFAIDADLAAGTADYFARVRRFRIGRSRIVRVQDRLISIENLKGGSQDDTLKGNDQVNILEGKGGNDTLIGRRGDDQIFGGAGNDRMIWNNGDGSDLMRGGSGRDIVEVNGAAEGNTFELNSNGNRVDFRRTNLGLFQLDIDDVEKIEVNGGNGNDSLAVDRLGGTDLKEIRFDGGDGNDVLTFSSIDDGKEDFLFGDGSGVVISTDNDSAPSPLSEEDLEALLEERQKSGNGNETVIPGGPNGSSPGSLGEQPLAPGGTAFNPGDVEIAPDGSTSTNTDPRVVADGGAGDDFLTGGNNNDILVGGVGDDFLNGGAGDDFLIGGTGNNILTGGSGADIFELDANGFAEITDFTSFGINSDRILIRIDSLPVNLGSVSAVRDALTFDQSSGLLSLDGVQIASIKNARGGFDIDRDIDFIQQLR